MLPSRSAPAPFYEKVKQEISEKIASGIWQPHDRIPSEAELVAQYGFSRMTINRALRELTDEGLLVRLQGVGTFVAEPKGQSALFEIRSADAGKNPGKRAAGFGIKRQRRHLYFSLCHGALRERSASTD